MLYFSYKFFLYSFYSRFLKKYSRTFFFHLLYKFNLVVFDSMCNIIYYLFGDNSYFHLYFLKIKCRYSFLNTLLLSHLVLVISTFIKTFFYQLYNLFYSVIVYIRLLKYLFLSKNYYSCLFKNYLYMQILGYIRQFKNNTNLLTSDISFTIPVANRVITILKSPHVHKKARDQYFFKIHKIGFALKNLFIFYPKIFYLNFFNDVSIKLQRKSHFYS